MANIASVRLENFQSHLDTQLTFTEGLNVLIGQSDSGKTAVIRGIRWALFNQPRGTDFIRAGSDFVRVTITFDNGNKLIRERTASKNRYMTEKLGEERQVYESFGNQVPEEVLAMHNMRPLRIDRDHDLTIHLAQQLDGPFLLEQAGSMRAKTIGRISGAHYIDAAIRETSRDLTSLNQSKRWSEEQTEKLQTDLEPFKDVEQAGQSLKDAYKQLEILKSKQTKLDELLQKQATLQTITEAKETALSQLKKVENVAQMESSLQKLQLASIQFKALSKQQRLLHDQQTQLERVRHILNQTNALEQIKQSYNQSDQMESRRSKLTKLQHQYISMIQIKNKAQDVKSQTAFVQEIDSNWQEAVRQLEQKRFRYQSIFEQLKKLQAQINEQKTIQQSLLKTEQGKKSLEKLTETLNTYQLLKNKLSEFAEVNRRLKEGRRFVDTKKEELYALNASYEELLNKDGVCPTCGQRIEHSHTHK